MTELVVFEAKRRFLPLPAGTSASGTGAACARHPACKCPHSCGLGFHRASVAGWHGPALLGRVRATTAQQSWTVPPACPSNQG